MTGSIEESPKARVMDAKLQRHVFVCTGVSCSERESQQTLEAFWDILNKHGLLYGKRGSLEGSVIVTTCGSVGFCNCGPAVLIYPDGVWYHSVTADKVPHLVEEHLIHGRVVNELLGVTVGNSPC